MEWELWKKKPGYLPGLLILWWALRDSNPEPRDYESPALTVAPIARAEREYSKTIASFTSYPLKVTGACHSGADSVEIA